MADSSASKPAEVAKQPAWLKCWSEHCLGHGDWNPQLFKISAWQGPVLQAA